VRRDGKITGIEVLDAWQLLRSDLLAEAWSETDRVVAASRVFD
jgi:hypothetical protein